MDTKTMNCHYCGFLRTFLRSVLTVRVAVFVTMEQGLKSLWDELAELFPQARILRMDVDTTRKKEAVTKLFLISLDEEKQISCWELKWLPKGLDFPNVTLVGVLNADTALNLPDFRSSERTFQLLTQVAGRAGRAEKARQVLIQSYNPQHYAIRFAKRPRLRRLLCLWNGYQTPTWLSTLLFHDWHYPLS